MKPRDWADEWSTPEDVDAAAKVIRSGGLVAFPTETVYGLGADASNSTAVRSLYETKGRPGTHPVIVHLADVGQLDDWARNVPHPLRSLAERLWPGPLTIVVPRHDRVSDLVTGGRETVGLRVPDHPVARRLIQAAGTGLAGPSANRFGRVSPTSADHVRIDFGSTVPVLDGGPTEIGLESTIVECVDDVITLLRPGGIPVEIIEALAGRPIERVAGGPSRAPGMLASHYAPSASVRLVDQPALHTELDVLTRQGTRVGVFGVIDAASMPAAVEVLSTSRTADSMAHTLYRSLREADVADLDVVLVVLPDGLDGGLAPAVADRLRRAASPRHHET